jgi:hypothetical protein
MENNLPIENLKYKGGDVLHLAIQAKIAYKLTRPQLPDAQSS